MVLTKRSRIVLTQCTVHAPRLAEVKALESLREKLISLHEHRYAPIGQFRSRRRKAASDLDLGLLGDGL